MSIHDRVETYTITDLLQIKALADPLRQQILGAFVAEPRTTKQVAVLLDQPATKLYHHVDLLERVGLIRLVATKPKRGTTEKYFQAIAYRFMVAESSLGGEVGAVLQDTLAKAFASAQTEIRKAFTSEPPSAEDAHPHTILAIGALRIAPGDIPELQKRIMDVVKDLGSDSKDSERTYYRYLVAVYPSKETDTE